MFEVKPRDCLVEDLEFDPKPCIDKNGGLAPDLFSVPSSYESKRTEGTPVFAHMLMHYDISCAAGWALGTVLLRYINKDKHVD